MTSHLRGVTLLELLMVLTIAGLLALIAAPTLGQLTQALRVTTTADHLRETLGMARLTALTRNQPVVITPLGNWSNGWQVFVDTDEDSQLTDADQLLFRHAQSSTIRISAALTLGNQVVVYVGNGFSKTPHGNWLAGRFKVCPLAADTDGIALVIRFGGRVRAEPIAATECQSDE